MTKEIEKWLLEWFKNKGVSFDSKLDYSNLNYFEVGWIDSLGVIELICAIEEYYGINFTEQHFQDRRFSTVGGLSEIIQGLSNKEEDLWTK